MDYSNYQVLKTENAHNLEDRHSRLKIKIQIHDY